MAAIAHFGTGDSTTASAASGTGSALTVAKPANVAVGDLLIGVFYSQFSGTVTTPPSGWTLIQTFAPRAGGVYYLPVPDAATLSGLPASWSIVMSGTGRLAFDVHRVTGAALASPVDVVGAAAAQNALATFTLPSVTTTQDGDLLEAVAYWNNSSTAQSTYTPDAAMTDGEQVKSPATGNTSGIDVATQSLGTAGATGTRSFTTTPTGASNGGFMFAIKSLAGFAASATMSGTGTLSASASSPTSSTSASMSGTGTLFASTGTAQAGPASLSGAGTLSVAAAPGSAAPAVFSGSGQLSTASNGPVSTTSTLLQSRGQLAVPAASTPIQKYLAKFPFYTAHRGGSADWPEETLYAYTQAAAWNAQMALEISVWQSSDGVWVCSHDQTTGRIFNQNLDIPSNTWATLSQVRSTVGNYPIARIEDILNPLATGDRVIFVDDKPQVNVSALLDLLDTYGGKNRFVAKGYCSSATWADAATSRGYQTWGYYYSTDVPGPGLPANASHWSMLGMDIVSPTIASWQILLSAGKPTLAHIISSSTQMQTAQTYHPDGYMVAAVQEAVPQSVVANTPFTGTGTLSASAASGSAALAMMGGTGTLSTLASPGTGATAALSGTGTLQTTATPASGSSAAMSGAGTLAAGSTTQYSAAPAFSGIGQLIVAAVAQELATAPMSGSGTLSTSVTNVVMGALASLISSGQLSTFIQGQQSAVASLSGSGSLSATVRTGSTRAVVLETSQPAFRWKNEPIANRWWVQQATARWATYRES